MVHCTVGQDEIWKTCDLAQKYFFVFQKSVGDFKMLNVYIVNKNVDLSPVLLFSCCSRCCLLCELSAPMTLADPAVAFVIIHIWAYSLTLPRQPNPPRPQLGGSLSNPPAPRASPTLKYPKITIKGRALYSRTNVFRVRQRPSKCENLTNLNLTLGQL